MTTIACTLVTPLRNERDNIETLWQSITGQSIHPAEWIITDNGSTDGTYEWLTEHAAGAPFAVRAVSLKGLTIAQMLNAAIREAKHPVIACCHGGTRIPAQWLEHLLAPFVRDPGVDVAAGVWEPFGLTSFEQQVADSLHFDFSGIDEKTYLPASRSVAFRRSAWEQAGGFPEWLPRFGEDTLFDIRLHAAGMKFALAKDAVVGWRPKSDLRSLLRQQRFYNEANACIGLQYADTRFLARLAAVVSVVLFAVLSGLYPVAGALLAALFAGDYLRLKRAGYYKRFGHYFLWAWLISSATQWGLLKGLLLRLSGRVSIPAGDRRAVQAYRAMSR